MEPGNLLVEGFGEEVNIVLVLASSAFFPKLELGQDLVGEGARHDK